MQAYLGNTLQQNNICVVEQESLDDDDLKRGSFRFSHNLSDLSKLDLFYTISKKERTFSAYYYYSSRDDIKYIDTNILFYLLDLCKDNIDTISLQFMRILDFIDDEEQCFLCHCHQLGFNLANDTKTQIAELSFDINLDIKKCALCQSKEQHKDAEFIRTIKRYQIEMQIVK